VGRLRINLGIKAANAFHEFLYPARTPEPGDLDYEL
jgi:hypothetical protein